MTGFIQPNSEVKIWGQLFTVINRPHPQNFFLFRLPFNMAAFLCSTPLNVQSNTTSRTTTCARTIPHASTSITRRSFGTLLSGIATAIAITPNPALADKTPASVRRAFERYYPRILAGGVTLREIGDSLSKGDIAAANEAASSKEFDVKFRRALSIYATSFSDSVLSQQSRDLLFVTDRLFNELAAFKNSTSVTDEVMEHYKICTEAYLKYNKIARLPKEMVAGL